MLHYETNGPIATITIDNPPLNVFTPEMHRQLHVILRDFNADPAVHCGILTGAGNRSFCAGDDIKSPRAERSRLEVVERHLSPKDAYDSDEYPGWESEVAALPRYKPIVGAVNGHCYGQGFVYLMLLTDIRYATSNSAFGLPEIAYGMGGAGGALGLGKMIPHAAAMELLLLGEKIPSEKAARMFLINDVVEPDELMDRALAAANRIASMPPLGVRVEMEAYQRSLDLSRADSLAMAGHMYRLIRAVQPKQPPLSTETPKK